MFATASKKRSTPIKKKRPTPRKYQKLSTKFLIDNPESGLFLAPGLGKTLSVLLAFEELRRQKKVKTMLVVSKIKIIYDVWPEEIEKWGFPFSISMVHGPKKAEALEKDADIYLLNFEGLEWLHTQMKRGVRGKFDWVVYDESSKIKNTKTKRFKAIKKISSNFKRRSILTGSPAPNSLKDIFGQIYAIDMGRTFGPFITNFLTTYFYPSGYMGYDWKLMPGAEQKIYKKIKPLILRFGLDQIPDLPKLVIHDVYVDLDEKAEEVYLNVEKDFIHSMEEGTITAANAGVKSQKLRQIASGNVYDEDGKAHKIHDKKIEALTDIIEELQGSPCLVAFEFRHELNSILEIYSDAPFLVGGVSPKQGSKIKDDWNKGLIPILLCQYETVSHGLNLQYSGYNIIMYSFTWNLESYEQLILRIRRSGQKSDHVVLHRIIARSTIEDTVIIPTLNRKDKVQQSLLKAMENVYMNEKTSEEKFKLSDNEAKISILKKHIEDKGLEMPIYYWGKKDSDKLFMTDLIKILASLSEVDISELVKKLGEEAKKGKSLVVQLREVVFGIFKVKASTSKFIVEDDLLLKSAASTVKDVTGEYDKSTKEENTMGTFKTPKSAESTTAKKETEAKKTTSKKKVAAKKAAPSKKKVVAKKETAAKKTTSKKTVSKKKVASSNAKKTVGKKSSVDTKKMMSMLARKNGASVSDMAESLGIEEVNVRQAIGRLRANGEKIKSLGGGVFKYGK